MSYLLYFVGIYFFVTVSQLESALTTKQYKEWNSGRICEDEKLKDLVDQICYKLFLMRKEEIENPYDEGEVKRLSRCEPNVPVQFQDGPEEALYWRHVGKCYLGKTTKTCVTMGKEKNEVLVYSFDGKGCVLVGDNYRYEMMIEDVPTEVSTESPKGGFLNMILNLWSKLY